MRDVPRGLAVGARWMPGEYAMPPRAMARRLIGAVLARRLDDGTVLRGVIVETEAYLGAVDQASHARNGRRTARNGPMYMRGGFSYVYFTYGMHFCFNVVCDRAGVAGAVLVRALMPMGTPEQLSLMAANRGLKGGLKAGWKVRDLCRGPARLCRALRIDGALNAVDMTTSGALWIEEGDAGMLVEACGG
ncbi:MAG: DNA-3-methyladenine glycosylase, partial [Phycisphaerales bacterium]|nr:DNA-3-methyladenine glycosylase [Phycisphaerales bacterium]